MATTKLVTLESIDFPGSPHVRAQKPDPEIVAHYAQCYADKKPMPPVVVFYDPELKKFYLADGLHRCAAHEQLKRTAVMANVIEGPYMEALRYALTANANHGVRRSNADKRKCIAQALKQWPEVANMQIARLADVDDKTVASVRSEMEESGKLKASDTRVTTDGKTIPATKEVRKSGPTIDVEEIVKDALGNVIPDGVIGYWKRTPEVRDRIDMFREMLSVFRQIVKVEDPMYGEVNFTGVMGDMERIIVSLETAIPHVVCPQCQGHPETQKHGCRMCIGRGLISKFRWQTAVPVETKKMVEAKAK